MSELGEEKGQGKSLNTYDTSEVHGSWNCRVIHLNGKLKPLNWICFQWRAQVFSFLWIFKSASLSTRTATADKLTKSLGWKFLPPPLAIQLKVSTKKNYTGQWNCVLNRLPPFNNFFAHLLIHGAPVFTLEIKQEIQEIC